MPNQTDNHIIEEIKERIDIVSLISKYIEVKPSGKNYSARCPFHAEKTPSFMISPEIQRYKCFGCQKGGDIFTFTMEYEHIDFVEALEKLAKEAGVQLPKFNQPVNKIYAILEMINKLANEFFVKKLYEPIGKPALDYLINRGITKDAITTFGIGYAPGDNSLLDYLLAKADFTKEQLLESGLFVDRYQTTPFQNRPSQLSNSSPSKQASPEASQTESTDKKTNLPRTTSSQADQSSDIKSSIKDKFNKRVMFPIHSERGRVIAFSGRIMPGNDYGPKYLNSPETPIFHKRNAVFGIYQAKNEIRKNDLCLLCEGQIDMISTYMAGVRNIVAPQGTALTEDQLSLVKKYTGNVLLIFDTDTAGQAAVEKAFILCTKLGFNIYAANTGKYKDIDEMIQSEPAMLTKIIDGKQDAFTYLLSNRIEKMDLSRLEHYKATLKYVAELLQNVSDTSSRSFFIEKAERITGVARANFMEAIADWHKKNKKTENNYERRKTDYEFQEDENGTGSNRQSSDYEDFGGEASHSPKTVGLPRIADIEEKFLGAIINFNRYKYFKKLASEEKEFLEYFVGDTAKLVAKFMIDMSVDDVKKIIDEPTKNSVYKLIKNTDPDNEGLKQFFEAVSFESPHNETNEIADKELDQLWGRIKLDSNRAKIKKLRQLIAIEEEKETVDSELISKLMKEIEGLVRE